jgi:hypothetical protein
MEQRVLAEEGVQGNQINNNMTHLPTIEQRNESDVDEAQTSSQGSKSTQNPPPPPPLPLLRQQESESPSSILLSENQINLELKNGDLTQSNRSMNHSASSSSNDSIKSKKSSLLQSSPVSYRLEDLNGEGNRDGLVNLNFLSNTKKSEENRSYQHDY